MQLLRRALLALGLAAALAACTTPTSTTLPPIVFVHGNGDSAALWTTTLWRFESNGWPRDRLFALNMPYPLARDDDTKPQEGRSSVDDQMRTLAAEVERVRKATGASKVVLMGNSRGGNAIRSYIQSGGVDTVSHAILGGTPNHGVWANPGFRPNNEFNGAGPFLSALNAPKGASGDEVTPGVRWMTIRSDNNDKFAQPDGAWIGAKGTPTNVTFDGPALKGATNVVLPGRDHREVSYHTEAFAHAYRFITGRDPATTAITPESRVVLDGVVTSTGPGGPTNLPLVGAAVEVYATDAGTGERRGAPLVKTTVGADGRWGPLTTDANTPLEFVVSAPGYATHHVYRTPFARSSSVVHLRPERLADGDRSAAAVVSFVRPRGYFGLPRDKIVFDNQNPAPGIPTGVAGIASSKLTLNSAASRTVVGDYRSGTIAERVVGRSWPAAENHLATLELHY
ncbi:MAG TPA: alpha/beta fold hydrolase [Burkholderiaceae bacterium]|nr:alpha/beta fold hydrolase [Burkholderiaceae bacterium]